MPCAKWVIRCRVYTGIIHLLNGLELGLVLLKPASLRSLTACDKVFSAEHLLSFFSAPLSQSHQHDKHHHLLLLRHIQHPSLLQSESGLAGRGLDFVFVDKLLTFSILQFSNCCLTALLIQTD